MSNYILHSPVCDRKTYSQKSIRRSLLACAGLSLILIVIASPCIAQAPAGAEWVQATPAAGWPVRWGHTMVAHNGKLWVMGGVSNMTHYNDVWSSTDGTNWTRVTASAPWGGRRTHTCVVFNGAMWIIGGYNGSSVYGDVWYSNDGLAWTRATSSAPWSARNGHVSFAFDNKLWVAGGIGGAGSANLNDVWSSPDGTNWTRATAAAAWAPRHFASGAVHDGKMWILGGGQAVQNGGQMFFDVWHSTNGATWTLATGSAPYPGAFSHAVVTYGSGIYVMGGNANAAGNNAEVWKSSDGVNWVQLPNVGPRWSARQLHSATVFNNQIWLSGGLDSIGPVRNDVWYSSEVPSLHVLCVGIGYDGDDSSTWILNGEGDATRMFKLLRSLPNWAATNPPSPLILQSNSNNKPADLRAALETIRESTKPGDVFIFYFSGHGGFIPYDTKGKEKRVQYYLVPYRVFPWVFFGWSESDEILDDFLTDDALTLLLSDPKWDAVQKLILLDSCFSGGFWGHSKDEEEASVEDIGDLERLPRIALLAAAKEEAYSFTNPFNGLGFFTTDLVKLFPLSETAQDLFDLAATYEGDRAYFYGESVPLRSDSEPYYSPVGLSKVLEPSDWQPFYQATDDFAMTFMSPENFSPIASTGIDGTIEIDGGSGLQATIDGSASCDPDLGPDALTFAWSFVSVPAGSLLTSADIGDADTAVAWFVPDVTGTYELQLTVFDGLDSDSDNVQILAVAYRNVGDLVAVSETGKSTTLDRLTRKLTSVSTVTVTNNSSETIEAPMRVIVKNLTAGVTMPEASGTTPEGEFYYDLEGKLGLTTLAPGQSAALQIKFLYPSTLRMTYGLEFWGTAP